MKEVQARASGGFVPKVAVNVEADALEMAARTNLILVATEADGFEAESVVKGRWMEWKRGLPQSTKVPIGEEPSITFLNCHYYAALRGVVEKRMGAGKGDAGAQGRGSSSDPRVDSGDVGSASMRALMSGTAYAVPGALVQQVTTVSSRMILEHQEVGSYVNFEGVLLHCDADARSLPKRDSEASPKKARGASEIIDMVLLDGTGPVLFSFAGCQEVEVFLEAFRASSATQKFVSVTKARVAEVVVNAWNGVALTPMRVLHTVPSVGATIGTTVALIQTSTSPFVTKAKYEVPSSGACVSIFETVASRLRAPFRGTFRGVVREVQAMEMTQSGSPKLCFKLMDRVGCYIQCCALHHNAEKPDVEGE